MEPNNAHAIAWAIARRAANIVLDAATNPPKKFFGVPKRFRGRKKRTRAFLKSSAPPEIFLIGPLAQGYVFPTRITLVAISDALCGNQAMCPRSSDQVIDAHQRFLNLAAMCGEDPEELKRLDALPMSIELYVLPSEILCNPIGVRWAAAILNDAESKTFAWSGCKLRFVPGPNEGRFDPVLIGETEMWIQDPKEKPEFEIEVGEV